MKKLFIKKLTIALAVIMLITAVPLSGLKDLSDLFPQAEAVSVPVLSISCPSRMLKGSQITVSVTLNGAEGFKCGCFFLKFDNTFLKYVSSSEPAGAGDGRSMFESGLSARYSNIVSFGAVKTQAIKDYYLPLVSITFEVLSEGTTNIEAGVKDGDIHGVDAPEYCSCSIASVQSSRPPENPNPTDNPYFSVMQEGEYKKGNQINVAVDLNNAKGFTYGTFYFLYDKSSLRCISAASGKELEYSEVQDTEKNTSQNEIVLSCMFTEQCNAEKLNLINICFEVLDDTETKIEISADKNDFSGVKLPKNTIHTFSVVPSFDFSKGEIIEFGSYPQSEVKDEETLSALNNISSEWKSYGYYSGNGDYGSMVQGDWMKYCDVEYNGAKYRGVYFTKFRPYYTYSGNSSDKSHQDGNGYTTNTYYWFKYEPLKWCVLNPNERLVLSESIIDSQPYQNLIFEGASECYYNNPEKTVYANDYVTSSIRKWLNDDFYNTAFTSNEKSKIKTTKLDNFADILYPEYDSKPTEDKIFLLSYDESINSDYGFSENADFFDSFRAARGTDYAKIQGLSVSLDEVSFGYSDWCLRSPDRCSDTISIVSDYVGWVDRISTYVSSSGVRPAFKFNLKSEICESHTEETVPGKAPTCTEAGLTEGTKCSVCGAIIKFQETIPAKGHTLGEWMIVTAATVVENGINKRSCVNCDYYETEKTPKTESVTATDKNKDTELIFDKDCYDGAIEVTVDELFSGKAFDVLNSEKGNIIKQVLDIATLINGEKVQPSGRVWVKRLIPKGFNPDTVAVFFVNDSGTIEEIHSFVDGLYIYFEAEHFSEYAIVDTGRQIESSCTEHSYSNWTVTKLPTCGKTGTETRKCYLCNDVQTRDIPKTAHIEEAVTGKVATCTETGLSDGIKCSVCGEIIKAQETIHALGHNAGEWEIKTPAQIGIKGEQIKKCTVCGEVLETRDIPALEPEKPEYMLADVNGDGKITSADARLILRAALKLEKFNSTQQLAADIDGDKKVTSSDARIALRVSLKLANIEDYIKKGAKN